MSSRVENLTTEQTETALRFLLHRMSMETRGQMMAQLPVIYAKIYPAVPVGRIVSFTESAINAFREVGEFAGDAL